METVLRHINNWTLIRLPELNKAALKGDSPDLLVHALNREALCHVPEPEDCGPRAAEQLLVHLGLWGSSVARHYQERHPCLMQIPEAPFGLLNPGDRREPFLRYFSRIAHRTAAGHPYRDTYASLVRWNTPAVTVRWRDGQITLPGSFDDPRIRTYTGQPGEEEFFILLKKSEALALAANTLLGPLSSCEVPPDGKEATSRMLQAVALLTALHRLSLDFAALPPDRALGPDHFLDVMRQFAVHWRSGDVPPSGAEDPEFLKRDLVLGTSFPHYARHVRRVFPALLARERQELEALVGRPAVPALLLERLGLTLDHLNGASIHELKGLLESHPALAACCLLLFANARVSAAHLMLTKRFLFKPHRRRELAGLSDSQVVPFGAGTTGMLEQLLDELHRGRVENPLMAFEFLSRREVRSAATNGWCEGLDDANLVTVQLGDTSMA